MNVYLNRISGYASAMTTMYQSKRSWTRELEEQLYKDEAICTRRDGSLNLGYREPADKKWYDATARFDENLNKLCKIGKEHITLLRFIDLEFSVEGLHRGAQDDFDAHAKRLDNRIVRASTRLSTFDKSEKSEWYADKILTYDEALGDVLPEIVIRGGKEWVRTTNGYVRKDLVNNKDVLRGLYLLSIPSNFTAKCNITEFAHIVKLRDKNSNASPELKKMIESLLKQIYESCNYFTREFFYSIEN